MLGVCWERGRPRDANGQGARRFKSRASGLWIVARLGVDAPFELDVRGGAGGVGLGVLRVEEQRSRCVLHRELEALQLQRSDRACKQPPPSPTVTPCKAHARRSHERTVAEQLRGHRDVVLVDAQCPATHSCFSPTVLVDIEIQASGCGFKRTLRSPRRRLGTCRP